MKSKIYNSDNSKLSIKDLIKKIVSNENEIHSISGSFDVFAFESQRKKYTEDTERIIVKKNILKANYNQTFNELIKRELKPSDSYFIFTNFDNYKKKLNNLFEYFKGDYQDSTRLDFYKSQLGFYKKSAFDKLNSDEYLSFDTKHKVKFSQARKIEYLKELIKGVVPEENFKFEMPPPDDKKLFEDLFKEKKLYLKAKHILIENNFIKEEKGSLNWIYPEKKGFTTIQTVIALCSVLEMKQYIIPELKGVYYNIENEFNIKMNKSTFSRNSRSFKSEYENPIKGTNDFAYISLFRDIL